MRSKHLATPKIIHKEPYTAKKVYLYMPIKLKIKLLTKKIDFSAVSERQIRQAAARAINKSVEKGKTTAIREITNRFSIKASEVRGWLLTVKTNEHNLRGDLMASRFTLPISIFKPVYIGSSGTQTRWYGKEAGFDLAKRKSKGGSGVSVEVIKGKRLLLRSAYMSMSPKSGNFSVRAYGGYNSSKFDFTPDPEKSSRIMTVSPLAAILEKDVIQRLRAKASEDYEKELTRLIVDITKNIKY